MEVAADPVWIIPTNSDVSANRLVNAVNLAYGTIRAASETAPTLCITSLSGMEIKGTSLDSLSSYQGQTTRLKWLKFTLSPSQQKVWERVMGSN